MSYIFSKYAEQRQNGTVTSIKTVVYVVLRWVRTRSEQAEKKRWDSGTALDDLVQQQMFRSGVSPCGI